MPERVRLTQLTKASGCAAKIGPGILAQVMGGLPAFTDPDILVGFSTSDDAAVCRLTPDAALIQTVDFFTPVVDEAYLYGEIAAANALSDVYAMGGTPKLALNIVGFPISLPTNVLEEIMAGGAAKVREAGAVLVGGHSVNTEEPLYGLCVSGFVHPERVWRNAGAQPGDVLILTKQIGTGLVNTAVKGDMASPEAAEEAAFVMRTLNRKAKEAVEGLTVHACTDVTGFSLCGHAVEMAEASGVTLVLNPEAVPVIADAAEYAEMGLVPAGTYRNRKHFGKRVDSGGAEELTLDLLFDPQTSGGLLIALPAAEAADALLCLERAGLETRAAVIGTVAELDGTAVRLA